MLRKKPDVISFFTKSRGKRDTSDDGHESPPEIVVEKPPQERKSEQKTKLFKTFKTSGKHEEEISEHETDLSEEHQLPKPKSRPSTSTGRRTVTKHVKTFDSTSDTDDKSEEFDVGYKKETFDKRQRASRKLSNVKEEGRSSVTEGDVSQTESTTTKISSTLLLAEEHGEYDENNELPDSHWNVLVYGEPLQRTQEEIEEFEKLICYPDSRSVILDEKLPQDIEARVLEDEGLYVGSPLQISTKNLNRLEHRLLRENAYDWFGQDGQLKIFPDPYRPEPIQLYRDYEKEIEFNRNIRFVPARLDPFQEFQLDSTTTYEIIVDIGSINFVHHSLFSKEHVLSSRLQESFNEYSRRQELKTTERAENKLRALREAVLHSKTAYLNADQRLQQIHQDDGDNIERESLEELKSQMKQRIQKYRMEMRRTRLERDQSLWDDKAQNVSVLDSWKELKELRQEQGFTNSVLKLNIITIIEDREKERENWQADTEKEFLDLKEEYEETFDDEMSKYRTKMKEWIALRQKARKRHGEGDEENGEQQSSESSELSLDRKPVPPAKFDAEETREAIEKRFLELKKLPGEPKIVLELLKTAGVTAKLQLPTGTKKEEQRRKEVQNLRIQACLLFNGKTVYKSKPKEISQEFSAFFGLTIPIQINEWPVSLNLEIIQIGFIQKTKLAEIELPLPNGKTSIERCHMQKMEFYNETTANYSHAAVGSGIDFEVLGNLFDGIFTFGNSTVRIGWSADKDGNVLCPKGFLSDKDDGADTVHATSKQIHQSGTVQKWSENSQVDPNDPSNARWLNTVIKSLSKPQEKAKRTKKVIEGSDDSESNEFVLDKEMEEFDFCSMTTIEKSLRFKLLQLRDHEVPEFKGLKMISPFEEDIPTDIFDGYERRLKEDARKRIGESTAIAKGRKQRVTTDSETVYETNRLDKIREMRLSVLQLFENSLKQITFEDLVLEEQIPDIGTLGLNLMSLFQPKRPLRPTRKERKRVQGTALIDTKISLIVNIVRAFNLPVRKDADLNETLMTIESVTGVPIVKKRPERISGNYATVKPFVEVWFQRNVCRTTTALGSNPTWNQELHLHLTVPNEDYSAPSLSRLDDFVYLLVYDEVAIDLLEDSRRRETDIHQRLEKSWLGTITIPFANLYSNGRIEGTFKLNSPPVLLGYECQDMGNQFVPFQSNRTNPSSVAIARNSGVGITIIKEESATGETADMMSHVKSWKNNIQHKFPGRLIRPFVMTPEGDTVLCTRYLKPIEPPESLISRDGDLIKTMEDLAHYVSLFPSVRDSTLGITDYSLWFTSDVFVSTPGGGTEDNAVLLTCFFMYFNIPVWVVQGNIIPDGATAFVVTSFKGMSESEDKIVPKSFKNAVLVWNPCSGEYYSANDNFCPLQKVWAAIGKLNMWANTSDGERPFQIDWDIGKSKHWTPLFQKNITENQIPCVQPSIINYKPADKVQGNSLAQRIERHLKEYFMKWRKTSKTSWNRYCSATLRRLLPKLEETKSGKFRAQEHLGVQASESNVTIQSQAGSQASLGDEHLAELREIMTSYQMTGFPLHFNFSSMDSIVETVFATSLHTIDTKDVEFALAAYAKCYPASVYSVWIYVAALHRRK